MPVVTETGFQVDRWRRIAPEAPLGARVIVDLERLLAGPKDGAPVGVDLPNDADARALAPFFDRLALVAIAFPSFADGRGFSLAMRLRDLGYAGRLRATGHVIVDQFAHARACGFDEVEIDDALAARQPEQMWIAEAGEPLSYRRRLRHGAAAETRRAA